MGLFDKLKQIRTTKQRYFILQRRFYSELAARYPHIMNSNMADIANKLEDELTTLLCTSLKFKSIKIPLTSKQPYGIVNVQRSEPGFYYPQSQRGSSDIHYMNLEQYITDKGDMRRKHKEQDYMLAALSELKSPENAPRIVPANLDVYFKYLKEVMAYRSKFLCYTDEGVNNQQGAQFISGGLRFLLNARSMDITVPITRQESEDDYYDPNIKYYGSRSRGFCYRPTENDMFRLLDYNGGGGRHFSESVHTRLKIFSENYEEIKLRLEKEEIKKKRAYEICKSFIKQIRVYTLPFKVLKEIQK